MFIRKTRVPLQTRFLYRFCLNKFNASKNYYHVLNLAQSATSEDIKKAYYKLAK